MCALEVPCLSYTYRSLQIFFFSFTEPFGRLQQFCFIFSLQSQILYWKKKNIQIPVFSMSKATPGLWGAPNGGLRNTFDHSGLFYVHWNLDKQAFCLFASIWKPSTAAGVEPAPRAQQHNTLATVPPQWKEILLRENENVRWQNQFPRFWHLLE